MSKETSVVANPINDNVEKETHRHFLTGKVNVQFVDPEKLNTHPQNPRDPLLYNLGQMEVAISEAGGLTDPLHVSEKVLPDGTNPVLRGNRRLLTIKRMLKNPEKISVALAENLRRIPVIFVKGSKDWTVQEERKYILSDEQMDLQYAETWRAVRDLVQGGADLFDVAMTLLRQLSRTFAKDTKGNVGLIENAKTVEEKKGLIKSWFTGTLDQFLIPLAKMPKYVQDQFYLIQLQKDGVTPVDATIEIKLNRPNVQKLVKAIKADKAAEAWDDVTETGPTYNEVLQGLKDSFKGEGSAPVNEKLTPKEVRDLASRMKATAIKRTLLHTIGETSTMSGDDCKLSLSKWDEEVSKLWASHKTMLSFSELIKNPTVKELVGILIHMGETVKGMNGDKPITQETLQSFLVTK